MTSPPLHDAGRPSAASLDPRLSLAVFVLLVGFTFVVPRSAGLVVLAGYAAVMGLLAGLRPSRILHRLRPLLFFVPFILVLNAVLVAGRPLPSPLGFLSREGFASGVYLALRVVVIYVIYVAAVVFLFAFSPETVARGVAGLVRPLSAAGARRLALYSFLSMGFVPLFADELARIRTAQRFRGGAFEGSIARRLRSVRLLLVPLIVSAVHRSGQLALAVEIRGIERSIENILVLARPRRRDYVFAAVSAVIFLVATRA
jgi:energy-coupling factor transport system permease protein